MKKLLSSLALCALFPLASAQTPAPAAVTAPAAASQKPDASAAIEKKDPTGKFQKMHAAFLARGQAGPIGVLFLGDSITEGWTKAPHIWEHYYAKWQPANFGIGGDNTQHVIWRIANGELDGLHPKVVVVMIGTNNAGTNDAAEIAAADRKIVALIREKIPATKVLLLGIFPRGPRKNTNGSIDPWEKRMEIIRAVNADLAKLDDGASVRFLDLTEKFLGQDGKIPFSIMPEQLHPNAAGYQIWADAMQPLLTAMMK